MEQRIQRFSRILKLRENDRQAEQVVLAEERREEDTVLHRLDSLKSEKNQAIEDFVGGGERMVSRQEIWFQRQCIEVIEKHIDQGKENLNDVQRRIAGTENRLLERHRDVRVMEGYVDRLKTDACKAFFDVEQLELDDIAVIRHVRSMSHSDSAGTDLVETDSAGALKKGNMR
ncbi:MAG: flagellar FliJ family protein [Synergistaceae bacterium]|jgi:flagellar export protein FliJ|nr:flagellar FliJ family protein [Synergistaceae bacterium]